MNKRGLTWKQLDHLVKESVNSFEEALPLLRQKTSFIKRPVIEDGGFLYFGFDEAAYTSHFMSN